MKNSARHFISAQDVDREFLEQLFKRALFYKKIIEKKAGWLSLFWFNFRRIFNFLPLSEKIVASLFYEPSTRTRFSFEAAALLLGGAVIGTENAREFSSAAKGETTHDSIKVVGGYADVIVMRHHEKGAAKEAADVSEVPIINAGDGAGEHPTQTMLDLFTIWLKKGRIDNLTIGLAGDLKNGRTIHSLIRGMVKNCLNIRFVLISPKQLALPQDLRELIENSHSIYSEFENLDDAPLDLLDCLYMTRIQKERFDTLEEYEKVKNSCILWQDLADMMEKTAIILHPLPRVNEIPVGVDTNPRAAYFDQARYGLYIRMALLDLIING